MLRTKEEILKVLTDPQGTTGKHSNRYIIFRMLQAMFKRQTSFEQESNMTVEENGIGFNGVDSHFLSDVAKNSLRYGSLTPKQADKVAARLKKYSRQLVEIAEAHYQRTLPVCGYCGKTGHIQETCQEYQAREMGRNPEQLQLMETHKSSY